MRALILEGKDTPLTVKDWPDPQPKENEVVVDVKAAAFNRRDFFITQEMYPGIQYPGILGSDGAGTVGDREVLINPNIGWGDNPNCQSKSYQILGMPTYGTMAEKIVVGADRIIDKPAHLSWEEAAAVPLAGLTAYRALFTKGNIKPEDTVLINGVGGGVATFALQFAVAVGAKVFVTSGSDHKIEKAKALGASGGVSYKKEDWWKEMMAQSGPIDLVIDSAGGPGFNNLIRLCNNAARIVIYGGTLGSIPKLSPQRIFWKQISILGTSMGNDQEFADMVQFVDVHKIKPMVDTVYAMEDAGKAMEKMKNSTQFGKLIVKI
jgi:zinc-binding alcohol dehydrogenase/oxidoreductase